MTNFGMDFKRKVAFYIAVGIRGHLRCQSYRCLYCVVNPNFTHKHISKFIGRPIPGHIGIDTNSRHLFMSVVTWNGKCSIEQYNYQGHFLDRLNAKFSGRLAHIIGDRLLLFGIHGIQWMPLNDHVRSLRDFKFKIDVQVLDIAGNDYLFAVLTDRVVAVYFWNLTQIMEVTVPNLAEVTSLAIEY